MPDLGLNVLLKGKNMARLLGGLWVALRISLLSVAISIPLGILLGVLMSGKNPVVKAILRVYLEIIRIMPQVGLGPLGRDGIRHRVCAVGHGRDERPCERRVDLHPEAPV